MISTRGRYAMRLMVDLAKQDPAEFVPLKEIAVRQGISDKYLEAIVRKLVSMDFLEGQRGRGGGYRLKRKPSEYNAEEILLALEGTLAPVACLQTGSVECERSCDCETLPMWKDFGRVVHEYFRNISIEDLALGRVGAGEDLMGEQN